MMSRKVDECKPLPARTAAPLWFGPARRSCPAISRSRSGPSTSRQRLTLVQLSAQRERFLWDRGCIKGLLRDYLGGVGGYQGVIRVRFLSETAHV